MQCNLLNFCLLIASFCGTEDKALQTIALGKQVNLWVSKALSKKRWGVEKKRWSIAGRREKMVRSGAGEGKIKVERWAKLDTAAQSCLGLSACSETCFGVERTQLCHWHRLWAAVGTGLSQRAQQCPRWASLDLQSTSSLDSSAARHRDYTSNFLFLFLGRLVILWQKGRFTECGEGKCERF